MIFPITRGVAHLIGNLFTRIQNREQEVTWIDAGIAAPTPRVIVLLIWVLGLVIAHPYIPGSSSKAFQGVSVLAGVMLSLGSSGVISQAMSGLALMFSAGAPKRITASRTRASVIPSTYRVIRSSP